MEFILINYLKGHLNASQNQLTQCFMDMQASADAGHLFACEFPNRLKSDGTFIPQSTSVSRNSRWSIASNFLNI